MATFDGVNMFGVAVTVETAENPRATQENAYAGVSGIQSLDLGGRGRQTSIKGRLRGATPGALGDAENFVRSYNDGRTYTFVDNFGTTWLYVKLVRFQPSGRVAADPMGTYSRRYEVLLHHLI
jgi:hypothetical protein